MQAAPLVNGKWEVVIGLEVHAQVSSNAKLFSGAATAFGAGPNEQVSFIDAAFPGMLPVINEYCVREAVKTGLGLHAEINKVSVFDRKNYFYPDLPAGYQISQFKRPIVGEGYLDIDLEDGTTKRIGIERLHLEQDAGKSIHDLNPSHSYIDLNRAGVALMEIVSKPDMRSADEATAFFRKLRSLLRYMKTCDGNMERGNMRADVNISLHKPDEPYGTRAEIKNMNSFRFIQQAIAYEIKRQAEILESGGEVAQETRLFDVAKGVTRSMRSKEEAHDYRYFPDPDLPPLVIRDGLIDEVKAELPELPDEKKKRFMDELGMSAYDASVLVCEAENAEYYESVRAAYEDIAGSPADAKLSKLMANWVIGELFGLLNKDGLSITESKIPPKQLAGMMHLLAEGTISGKIAKEVFAEMWESGKEAAAIVKEKGLEQVSDDGPIRDCIAKILADNQDKVAEYKAGKDKLFGFFVGQTMKAMAGKANPKMVNDVLKELLG
ncbi:MAG: Asp-tRNA(Asn)/Glu-tRNA(Gln) amidotransferase subunit GatB [Alphaproteobacteria bacterium]